MSPVLADVILVLHFAFVLFVVGGLGAIWLGAWLGWQWVRNFWFRAAHLAAITFVAAEALAGVWCPLTVWEDALRGRHEEQSFVARWVRAILYWDFPGWLFTLAYCTFTLAVIATWWWIRPARFARFLHLPPRPASLRPRSRTTHSELFAPHDRVIHQFRRPTRSWFRRRLWPAGGRRDSKRSL